MDRQLLFLGTASGMPIRSSCSSILVEDEQNKLLIDVGGGHDLLCQFEKSGSNAAEVRNLFISHYDSDHILGIVPLMRAYRRWSSSDERIRIFCSAEVKVAIESLFQFVAHKHYQAVLPRIDFTIVSHGAEYALNSWNITFFSLHTNNTPQYGCIITFPDGKKLSFAGDEPLHKDNYSLVDGSDIIIYNAFCLHSDMEQFKPHEKCHNTVREAA